MKALIVGGGAVPSTALMLLHYQTSDLVLAADSGAAYLYAAGLIPHKVIGDMDSISAEVLEAIMQHGSVQIKRHLPTKDETDLDLCLRDAISCGATDIVILAAVGSRWDHSFGNLLLMIPYAHSGVRICIEDDCNRVFPIFQSTTIPQMDGRYLSLLAITPDVRNLRLSGVAYPLSGHHMQLGSVLCLSNQITGESASIEFDEGILMVFLSQDAAQ